MGLLTDIKYSDRKVSPSALRDPAYSGGLADEFGRGVNSALTGTHAGLRAIAGTAAEALGAEEFAQAQYQRARELEAQAQLEAPRVNSYKQVNDLRSGIQYVAGLGGGSLPSIAAGVGGGLMAKTALGSMAGATLAQVPIEAGDVALKQLDDSDAMAMDASERGLRQLGGGLGSAALQSVVPAALAGKLMGRGAQDAAQMSWKQVAGRNALGIPVEGLAEGGGDIIKQQASNENAAIDWESVKENTIGGMAAGGAMSTIGTAADLAYRNGPMAAEALSQARTSIKDKLAGAKEKTGVVLDEAGDTADGLMQKAKGFYEDTKPKVMKTFDDIAESDAGQKAKNLYERATDAMYKAKNKGEDVLGKIISGEDVGIDLKKSFNAARETVEESLRFSDNEKFKAAKAAGEELLKSKFGIDEETRAKVAESMSNLGDKASQVFIAKTMKAKQAAAEKAQRVREWAEHAFGGAKQGDEGSAPSSWDIDVEATEVSDTPALPGPAGAKPTVTEKDGKKYNWTPATGDLADDINAAREAVFNDPKSQMKTLKELTKKMDDGKFSDEKKKAVRRSILESLNPAMKTDTIQSVTDQIGKSFGKDALDAAVTDMAKGKSKKSEDSAGTKAVIVDTLRSIGFFEKHDYLFENRRATQDLGDGLLSLINQIISGKVDKKSVNFAADILGDEADYVVNNIVANLNLKLGMRGTENVFSTLNRINKAKRGEDGIVGSLAALAANGVMEKNTMKMFVDHASGDWVSKDPSKRNREEETATDRSVNLLYDNTFGDRADEARDLIAEYIKTRDSNFGAGQSLNPESEFGAEYFGDRDSDATAFNAQGGVTDGDAKAIGNPSTFNKETGERLTAEPMSYKAFGIKPNPGGTFKLAAYIGNDEEVKRIDAADTEKRDEYIATVSKFFPTDNVYYDAESGLVIAEAPAAKDEFTRHDSDAMRFDDTLSKNGKRNSESKVMLGGNAFDAVKITNTMLARGNGNEVIKFDKGDFPNYKQRMADAFKEGVFRLANGLESEIGNALKPDLVIGYVDKKPVRWKDIQRTNVNKPDPDKPDPTYDTWGQPVSSSFGTTYEASHRGLAELRQHYIEAFGSDAKLKKLGLQRWSVDPDQREDLKKEFEDLGRRMEAARTKTVARDQGLDKDERQKYVDKVSPVVAQYNDGISVRRNILSERNTSSVEFSIGGQTQSYALTKAGAAQLRVLLDNKNVPKTINEKRRIIKAIQLIEQPHTMKDDLVPGSEKTISARRVAAVRAEMRGEEDTAGFDSTAANDKVTYNSEGMLRKKAAEEELGEGGARTEWGNDEQIHVAEVMGGGSKVDLKRTANQDGSSGHQRRHNAPNINYLQEMVLSWDKNDPMVAEAQKGLKIIVENFNKMSENDQKALARLAAPNVAYGSVLGYDEINSVNQQFREALMSFSNNQLAAEIKSRKSRLASGRFDKNVDVTAAMREEVALGEEELARRNADGIYDEGSITPEYVVNVLSDIYKTYKHTMKPQAGRNAGEKVQNPETGKWTTKGVKVDQTAKREQMRESYEFKALKEDYQQEREMLREATEANDRKAIDAGLVRIAELLNQIQSSVATKPTDFPSGKMSIKQKVELRNKVLAKDATLEDILKDVLSDVERSKFYSKLNRGSDKKMTKEELKEQTADIMAGYDKIKEAPSPKAQAPEQGAARFGDKATLAFTKGYRPDLSIRLASKDERASIDRALGHISMHLSDSMPPLVGVAVVDGDTNFAGKAIRDSKTGEMHMLLSAKVFDDVTPVQNGLLNKDLRVIFHEVGHLFDYHNSNFTDTAPELQSNGVVVKEIAFEAKYNPIVKQWFEFTLNHPKRHKETFAQAFALYTLNPKLLHEILPETYTFISATIRNSGGAGRPATDRRASKQGIRQVDSGETNGGLPDASSVAAKKQAAVKLAKANDPQLLKDIEDAVDPKQLQRLIEVLADKAPKTQAMKRATERLREMIAADESIAYGMQTKKYSLMSTLIHDGLEKAGFAATHDSPIRHEGIFDWRTYAGSGEGNAAFGAGTYLSTADGVHRSYKDQFSAKPPSSSRLEWGDNVFEIDDSGEDILKNGESMAGPPTMNFMAGGSAEYAVVVRILFDGATPEQALRAAKNQTHTRLAEQKERLKDRIEELGLDRDVPREQYKYVLDSIRDLKQIDLDKFHAEFRQILDPKIWNRLIDSADKLKASLENVDISGIKTPPPPTKSPTYHVSVDIKPEQLLDWDKPFSEQSEFVQKALRKAGFEDGLKKQREYLDKHNEARDKAREAQDKLKSLKDEEHDHFVELDKWLDENWFERERANPKDDRMYWIKETNRLYDLIKEAKKDMAHWASLAMSPAMSVNRDGIYKSLVSKLGSQAKASEYLQSLGILGHKYAAVGGKNDTHPNYVIYDDSKISTNYVSFSNQHANGPAANAAVRKEVKDYIEKVLGKSVKLHWAKLTHAGDFTRTSIGDIIRLSLHSLNPKSVAYHESLHAFFAQLRDANAKDIIEVIEKAASKPEMVKRLMDKFANQPAVLNQLQDPEERAAYMFQLWAEDPKGFPIAIAPRTAMEKIVAFIHRVLGTWSNDQRALHIMEYFHSGEYAKNMGKPNEVRRALMDVNRNGALETAKEFTMPLFRLGDAIASTGDARIRDLNIPAFNEIVDLIKRRDFSTPLGSGNSTVGAASRIISGQVYTSNSNGDNGFIPAARMQATKRLNNLADRLAGYTQTQLDDALESLQSEKPANSAEGRLAAREIKAILKETYEYMTRAGVKIGNLGPDYFPRVWDTHYISKNEQAFRDMMQPYVQSGEFEGNVTDLILGLTSREGNEFGVETSIPGMQHKKQRLLSFIKAEDAAPFLTKDLYGTLGTYITQATRRAEWDRRFGFNVATGKVRMEKFYEDAKAQGAKDADFELLEKYFKSVDGTLGDDINPKARRLMGNVMVYQNIRLLPMAALSMMVDPMGILVRGGTAGEAFNSFKRGMASIPQSYGKKYTPDEAEKLAEMLGIVENAMLSNAMGDAYTQGMVGGTAKKWNQLFFKYNAVEGLNRSFRVGATEAAISFIKRHADGKASPHSQRWMDELGLQAGDVKVRPDGRLAVSEKDGLTKAQVYRVHAAVNMWVDGAVLRPNAADKPIWMNDPHWALIAHLKQFVWSFQETILKRVMHEMEQGNFRPAMAVASYVPVMIAVDTAKGIILNGGDVPEWKKDWGVWEYTNYGIERSGLYGVGQYGNDIWSDVQRGGVGIGALAGPTIDQLGDAVQATGGNKEFAPFVLDAMPANALYSNL